MQATLDATDPAARTRAGRREAGKLAGGSLQTARQGRVQLLPSERGDDNRSQADGLGARPATAGRRPRGRKQGHFPNPWTELTGQRGMVLTKTRTTSRNHVGDAGRRMGCGHTALLTPERGCQGFQAKAPGRVDADPGATSSDRAAEAGQEGSPLETDTQSPVETMTRQRKTGQARGRGTEVGCGFSLQPNHILVIF